MKERTDAERELWERQMISQIIDRGYLTHDVLNLLYVRDGMGINEIAERTGKPAGEVRGRLLSLGMMKKPKPRRIKGGQLTREGEGWLWQKYIVEKKSIPEIAKILKKDRDTVERWLRSSPMLAPHFRKREEAKKVYRKKQESQAKNTATG